MSLLDTLRRLWETRHLPPQDRAAELDPDLDSARRELHDYRDALQALQARKWLREHGYRPEDHRQ